MGKFCPQNNFISLFIRYNTDRSNSAGAGLNGGLCKGNQVQNNIYNVKYKYNKIQIHKGPKTRL